MYIRRAVEEFVQRMLVMFKIVLVTGPRQVGKVSLLKRALGDEYSYVTLGDIHELDLARSDPKLFFLNHPGKLVIDEVQLAPELFREIKRIVDQREEMETIVLTGSQTFALMEHVSESLAGRIGILELNGLSLREIQEDSYNEPFIPNHAYLTTKRKPMDHNKLWDVIHRGSMPELYRNEAMDWQLNYSAYVKTYIDRDVRILSNVRDLHAFSLFMVAVAARTGQLLNYGAIANEIGVDQGTVKRWMTVLEASGIIVLVQPFANNQLKRIVKTPILYFMDTGLVCYLLKWLTPETLMHGAMSGPILETFAVSEIVKSFQNRGIMNPPISFYRDKDMREIDLIVEDSGVLYPVEIKKTAAPKKTMSRHFSVLDKAVGYEIGQQTILCLVETMRYISTDLVAYPITEI